MMLTNLQYELLQYISDHPYSQGTDLESLYPSSKFRFQDEFSQLIENKLVIFTPTADEENHLRSIELENKKKIDFNMGYHLILSSQGRALLEQYLNDKKYFRFTKTQAICAIVSIVVSAVLSIVSIVIDVLQVLN